MTKEIDFEKYRKRGAYHWQIYFGSLFKVDSFLRGRYQLVIYFLKRAQIQESSRLLEVGCGDGALSGLIYKTFGCDISGVDPSPDGVRFAREMFARHGMRGDFDVSEGYRFRYPDHHFDFIVLADVIEHLQHPDAMLTELKRLLKPGGYVVITTPVRCSEYPEDTMHVREFYPDELKTLCATYFGSPEEVVYSHPVVWYELYTYGRKINRSLIRLYCRFVDKVLGANIFFKAGRKNRWVNFKQQGLLLTSQPS